MRVGVPCDRHVLVTETAGNLLNVYAVVCEERRVRVPELMYCPVRKSRRLRDGYVTPELVGGVAADFFLGRVELGRLDSADLLRSVSMV